MMNKLLTIFLFLFALPTFSQKKETLYNIQPRDSFGISYYSPKEAVINKCEKNPSFSLKLSPIIHNRNKQTFINGIFLESIGFDFKDSILFIITEERTIVLIDSRISKALNGRNIRAYIPIGDPAIISDFKASKITSVIYGGNVFTPEIKQQQYFQNHFKVLPKLVTDWTGFTRNF